MTVGVVDGDTFPTPVDVGYRSLTAPAIACQDEYSNRPDCIIAFTHMDDGRRRVRTRTVDITKTSTGYSLSFGPIKYVSSGSTNGRTSSRIAMFWEGYNNRWVIMYRSHRSSTDQGLIAYVSTNGDSWGQAPYYYSYPRSSVGPVAASYLNDLENNYHSMVMYARD